MATRSEITRRGFLGRTVSVGAAALAGLRPAGHPVHAAKEKTEGRTWRIGCYTRPDTDDDLDAILKEATKARRYLEQLVGA